ncbi:MAG: polyhydroxyalkanoate synthesis regulator DNA-binding domain-containing protein [candidate division WOR-3 bacterium]
MRKKVRLIHRYSNRKLYDTVSRAFVTLGQVMGMIGRGIGIKVVDKASGIDMTHLVRLRAIANETERLARRMADLASKDSARLQEMASELGRLTSEMARLRRMVKKEAQNGS